MTINKLKEFKNYAKNALKGEIIHQSKVLEKLEKDEDGNLTPVFRGVTRTTENKTIRRANLKHNNNKRRRMIKYGIA